MGRKVLITGAHGQLAGALRRMAPDHVEIVALGRTELDIGDETSVRAALEQYQPTIVWNGAAYNAVDRAQSVEGARAAMVINALGPAVLATACRDYDARLVHFSTDFVFDGHACAPYTEEDATQPLSIYGASKLGGEQAVLAASPRHIVVRVQRLFGPIENEVTGSGTAAKPGGNFPLLMLRLAHEQGRVRVVNDQVGTPSYSPDVARAAWQLVELVDGGLFHLANEGEVTFADYAETIFRLTNVSCEIERVSTQEYGAPAKRPLYSTLSSDKAYSVGVRPLRSWDSALAEYLKSDA